MFWRIQIDTDGGIVSCDPVEYQGTNKLKVIFVEAETKAGACSAAKAWYEKKLTRTREATKRWVDEKVSHGRCITCGLLSDRPDKRRCAACAARAEERRQARLSGSPRLIRKLTPDSALEDTRARSREWRKKNPCVVKLSLPSLLRQFDADGPHAFRAWLVAEIDRRSGTETAKEDSLPIAAE